MVRSTAKRFLNDYYDRGGLLPNRSNRLSYNCRYCWETVEGRHTTLYTHIVTHCAVINAVDKAEFTAKCHAVGLRERYPNATRRHAPRSNAIATWRLQTQGAALALPPQAPVPSLIPGVNDSSFVDESAPAADANARQYPPPETLSSVLANASVQSVDQIFLNDFAQAYNQASCLLVPGGLFLVIDFTAENSCMQVDYQAPSPATQSLSPVLGGHSSPRRPKTAEETAHTTRVRMLGACLRCKMLRKPCDENTPCQSCANLSVSGNKFRDEPCNRARLVDSLSIFASTYFAKIQSGLIPIMKLDEIDTAPGFIEILHFAHKGISITCPGSQVIRQDGSCIFILDVNDNEFGNKMAEYAVAIVDNEAYNLGGVFEISEFVKTALSIAYYFRGTHECSPNSMVAKLLELWFATYLLTSPSLNSEMFFYREVEAADDPPGEPGIFIQDQSYIIWQFRRILEKHTKKLAEDTINRIERAFVLPRDIDRFELFICTHLLVLAVERMCYFFRNIDPGVVAPAAHRDGLYHSQSMLITDDLIDDYLLNDFFPPPPCLFSIAASDHPWPLLPLTPRDFWSQADPFALRLANLLYLRDCVPRFILADGPYSVMASHPDEPQLTQEWFEAVQLTRAGLAAKCDIATEHGSLEMWEMRGVSRLFGLDLENEELVEE